MKRSVIISVTAAVLLCTVLTSFKKNQPSEINGIWIPKNINWKEGSFNTIYVYNDTNFIIVASSQNKNKNGTINFMSEQGLVISYRHIGKCGTDYSYPITYRLLHRSVTLSDEKLPSDFIKSFFLLRNKSKSKNELTFNNEAYLKTSLYTKSSIDKLKSLKNKFVPQLLI